jgi:hypothetical protein
MRIVRGKALGSIAAGSLKTGANWKNRERRWANDEAAPVAAKNGARTQMQNLRHASGDKNALRKTSARRE